jgi:hypothetical protein
MNIVKKTLECRKEKIRPSAWPFFICLGLGSSFKEKEEEEINS